MTYHPVCGSDAVTYSNECFFQCAQSEHPELTIFSQGECPVSIDDPTFFGDEVQSSLQDESPRCVCSMDYKPVCGTDMKTYGNICIFNCERQQNPALGVAAHGECPKPELVDAPVQHQLKPIPFRLKSASLRRNDENEKFCLCTREYRPVCGSNRVTYANPCEFNCAKKTNADLKILTHGTCDDLE